MPWHASAQGIPPARPDLRRVAGLGASRRGERLQFRADRVAALLAHLDGLQDRREWAGVRDRLRVAAELGFKPGELVLQSVRAGRARRSGLLEVAEGYVERSSTTSGSSTSRVIA